MKRKIYLACASILALTAALLTLKAQHTVSVVVALHDIRSGSQLTSSDVTVKSMHSDSVPDGALATTDSVNGTYAVWPLTAGEAVLGRELSNQPSGSSVTGGFDLPNDYRAVAIPVAPGAAVGGLLSPGDHVDIYATPNLHSENTTSASTTNAPGTTLLGHNLVVLQLRSDQGQSLNQQEDPSVHGLNFGSGKLGSVVVAVPAGEVDKYAAAAANETMYLALSIS